MSFSKRFLLLKAQDWMANFGFFSKFFKYSPISKFKFSLIHIFTFKINIKILNLPIIAFADNRRGKIKHELRFRRICLLIFFFKWVFFDFAPQYNKNIISFLISVLKNYFNQTLLLMSLSKRFFLLRAQDSMVNSIGFFSKFLKYSPISKLKFSFTAFLAQALTGKIFNFTIYLLKFVSN